MTRRLLFITLMLCAALPAWADLTLSSGGKLDVDSTTGYQPSPAVDATVLGDLSWTPSEHLGFYGDYSAGGSYAPISGAQTGLAATTLEGSYIAKEFLSRLSLSGVVNLSSEEPFYGAATSELLLSYGGPERSFFAAPRFTLVEENGLRTMAGGRLGAAVLVSDLLLVQPSLEGGVSVPGGVAAGWYLDPHCKIDSYTGVNLSLGLIAGYRKSYSTVLSSLVAGGPLLPLDTYDRFYLEGSLAWLFSKGMSLSAELPVDYTRKTYDATDGTTSLGVPTWLVGMRPSVELTLPLAKKLDLVVSLGGSLVLSNDAVERLTALSTGVHLELHSD